ncbi:GYD domain-containing protein [Streptomyces sp. A3M-1-3]|uniref:GYD domain-containing protein n=1 Tax=Streptomyces sp. A3M-1-3 TaxID=2962044 RepID=UPI0020B80478|nr:GYD domain-containing protein [Streptomyces sp. A3M-1-3]MCP3822648.1 GYD domain-containing protein [Streptomyces sp. A3M-1-3]
MPKYLVQASYTVDGLKGLFNEGGSSRREVVASMLDSLGGRLESMYFAFGEEDVYVVADLPSNVSAAALGLTVTATGAVRTKTVVLLTPEEIDEATGQKVQYRAPGA